MVMKNTTDKLSSSTIGKGLLHFVSLILVFFTYLTYICIKLVTKVAPPIFDEFEMNLMGHIDNLSILAPTGQGNHLKKYKMGKMYKLQRM